MLSFAQLGTSVYLEARKVNQGAKGKGDIYEDKDRKGFTYLGGKQYEDFIQMVFIRRIRELVDTVVGKKCGIRFILYIFLFKI